MKYNTLQFNIKAGIAHIRLDNPPGNPTSLRFFDELLDVCETRLQNEDFLGLIIQSSGRHFSSGAIIQELLHEIRQQQEPGIPLQMSRHIKAFHYLREMKQPSVALLGGICYGSGFELALCARYRIAEPKTLMSLPETDFKLMPGLGGIHTAVYRAGTARTIEMVLSGEVINADEALRLQLIDEVVPRPELYKRALLKIRPETKHTEG